MINDRDDCYTRRVNYHLSTIIYHLKYCKSEDKEIRIQYVPRELLRTL